MERAISFKSLFGTDDKDLNWVEKTLSCHKVNVFSGIPKDTPDKPRLRLPVLSVLEPAFASARDAEHKNTEHVSELGYCTFKPSASCGALTAQASSSGGRIKTSSPAD